MSNTEKKETRRALRRRGSAPRNSPQSRTARAVAVKDASQNRTRPRIIAKGEGGVAEQILQIAWANNVRVREDADLVEVLAAIDVESEIPIEAFAAVAEILSYVYRANAAAGAQESEETIQWQK